jgi:hypothetical protein
MSTSRHRGPLSSSQTHLSTVPPSIRVCGKTPSGQLTQGSVALLRGGWIPATAKGPLDRAKGALQRPTRGGSPAESSKHPTRDDEVKPSFHTLSLDEGGIEEGDADPAFKKDSDAGRVCAASSFPSSPTLPLAPIQQPSPLPRRPSRQHILNVLPTPTFLCSLSLSLSLSFSPLPSFPLLSSLVRTT